MINPRSLNEIETEVLAGSNGAEDVVKASY